jgi:hypothetical protein
LAQKLTAELRLSYSTTSYVINDARREVIIRPGVKSRDVDRLLCRFGAQGAAFVTAWNPHSRMLSRSLNHQRQGRLERQLSRMRLRYMRGEGRGETDAWPPERSALVLGATRETAMAIGRLWQQNAIVFVRCGHAAELIMLR